MGEKGPMSDLKLIKFEINKKTRQKQIEVNFPEDAP